MNKLKFNLWKLRFDIWLVKYDFLVGLMILGIAIGIAGSIIAYLIGG